MIFDLRRLLFSSFPNDTFPWRREVPRLCFDGIIWNRRKRAKLSDRSYDLVPEYPFLRQTGKVTLETFGLWTGLRNFLAPETISNFAPKRYMYSFSFVQSITETKWAWVSTKDKRYISSLPSFLAVVRAGKSSHSNVFHSPASTFGVIIYTYSTTFVKCPEMKLQ